MTRLVRQTIKRLMLVGISLTISGLAVNVSAQTTGNGFGESQTSLGLLASNSGRNSSDTAPVTLASNDKIDTAVKAPEAPARVPVLARPRVALSNSIFPAGAQPKGTDLILAVAFTNSGGQAARVFTVVNPIPAQTDFKLNSTSTVLGTTGMTAEAEFSNDNATTWTYAPVSGGGGALEGYDRSVTHVRWRFNGSLSQTFPDNGGSVAVTARIR